MPDERLQPRKVVQGDGAGGKGFVKSIPSLVPPTNAPYLFFICAFLLAPACFSTSHRFTLQGFLFIWHVSAQADSCFRAEVYPSEGALFAVI